MKNLKILNSKEVKEIYNLLSQQYSYEDKLDYAFLRNKDDIFLISRDLAKIDASKFRINNLGLYFGEVKHGKIRLSIEGSQLIGNKCTKNIIMLDYSQSASWLRGEDVKVDSDINDLVIVRNKHYFLGCGKVKNSILLNHVPKERRLKI